MGFFREFRYPIRRVSDSAEFWEPLGFVALHGSPVSAGEKVLGTQSSTHLEYLRVIIDERSDSRDDVIALFQTFNAFNFKLAAFRLVKNVGSKQRGQILGIHLVSRNLKQNESDS